MKELSIEEKAKAYDKALEDAKYYHSRMGDDVKCVLEEVFSELRESEDEGEDDRIRRALLNTVKYYHFKESPYMFGISKEQVIAWFEKQRREKDSVVDFKAKDWYVSKVDGKIHNICYSVDKVEPRFKIGDWVVFNNKFHDSIYQIENIENYVYTLRHFLGGSMPLAFGKEDMIRHWNIQDAKNGDVLVVNDEVFIYAHRKQLYPIAVAHCFVDSAGGFYLDGEFGYTEKGNSIHPATKEQRDALMEAMANAGYTFDFDKKELTKIENEIEIPFGAKDSELQEVTYYIPEGFHAEIEGNNVVIKKGEQNSAWSEEDIRNIENIDSVLFYDKNFPEDTCVRLRNWLKSLRPQNRWKPSDVQMELLKEACDKRWEPDGLDPLYVLYQDLKKLRKE